MREYIAKNAVKVFVYSVAAILLLAVASPFIYAACNAPDGTLYDLSGTMEVHPGDVVACGTSNIYGTVDILVYPYTETANYTITWSGDGGFEGDDVDSSKVTLECEDCCGTSDYHIVVNVVGDDPAVDTEGCEFTISNTIKVVCGEDGGNGDYRYMNRVNDRKARVDIHGVPIPESDPSNETESDRPEGEYGINMYSLEPSYSVSDAMLMAEGGELVIEIRRTVGINGYDLENDNGTYKYKGFADDLILGPGWNVNIGATVMTCVDTNRGGLRATVRDEVGNTYEYFRGIDSATHWSPDIYWSINGESVKGKLESGPVAYTNGVLPVSFVFTKQNGTKLYFSRQPVPIGGTTSEDFNFDVKESLTGWENSTVKYVITKAEDRNGNTLIYQYGMNHILPEKIYEENHPEKFLQFEYTYMPGNLWGLNLRLTKVIDPLGRETVYAYNVGGYLAKVTRPAVVDPDNPTNMINPEVTFSYSTLNVSENDMTPGQKKGLNQPLRSIVCPETITDARGHATSFDYKLIAWPKAMSGAPEYETIVEQNAIVTSVTTVDGTAYFYDLITTMPNVKNRVVDTRGVTNEYNYLNYVKNNVSGDDSFTDVTFMTMITNMTRSTYTSNGVDMVTYRYTPDCYGNMISVTDINGHTIEYQYVSAEEGDPYDQPVSWLSGRASTNYYKTFGLPAKRILDVGGLDLVVEYRYDTTFNKLIKRIDPEGIATEYKLDDSGNRTNVIAALGTDAEATTVYQYNTNGFLVKTIDPDSRATEFVQDSYGYVKDQIAKGYNGTNFAYTTTYTRDLMGKVLSATDPNGNVSSNQYDNLDRIIKEILPAVVVGNNPLQVSTVEHLYDLNGNEIKTTIDNGTNDQVTVRTYDDMNRLVFQRLRVANPDSNDDNVDIILTNTYDVVGQIATTADSYGNTTTFEYDEWLRLIKKTLPLTAIPGGTTNYVETYSYNTNSGAGLFNLRAWKPARVLNSRGYAVDAEYDNAYRLIQSVLRSDDGTGIAHDAEARTNEPATQLAYNNAGDKISQTTLNEDFSGTNVANQVTYFFYDHQHRLTATVVDMDGDGPGYATTNFVDDATSVSFDADDLASKTVYDDVGNVLEVIDAEGNAVTNQYDGVSRLVKVTMPAVDVFDPVSQTSTNKSPVVEYQYDPNGNQTLVTDARGIQTTNSYDARNQLTASILDYDEDGNFETNGQDVATYVFYDYVGNVVKTVDGNGNATETEYDRAFRQTKVIAPSVYDAETSTWKNPETVTMYDRNSNVTNVVDPRGIITESQYDELNRVRYVIADKGGSEEVTTESQYDANNNVMALILHNVAGGSTNLQTTAYVFDSYDRQVSETLPSVGDGTNRVTTTVYYRNGNVKTITDPKGQVTETEYDLANRVAQTRFKKADTSTEETRTFAYDKAGNLLTVDDLNGSTTNTYDNLYRLLTETRADNSYSNYVVTSYYDEVGNRTKCVYPETGRTLISHYEPRNLLEKVEDINGATTNETTYAYDLNGNTLNCTTPNGVVTTNSFDAQNRVLERSAKDGENNIYTVAYEYDLVGNRRSIDEDIADQGSRSMDYNYDDLYRLTSESWSLGGTNTSYEYTYDLAGNRLSMTNIVGAATNTHAYTYDDLNRLLTNVINGSQTVTYTYDVNGNRLAKDDGTTTTDYIYDVNDRLVEVQENSSTVFEASYDYRTRRLTKTENSNTIHFRYDGGVSFHELDGSSLTVEFIRGSGLGGGIGSILYSDRSGTNEFFTYNAVGHVVALTDDNGDVTKTDLYEAFGGITSSTGTSDNNRLANTKERDVSIGLDNHGFRFYDPEIGRYLTRDPIGYGDGPNVYLSVKNNPINFIDPLGLGTIDTSGSDEELKEQIENDPEIQDLLGKDPEGLAFLKDPQFWRKAAESLDYTEDTLCESGFGILGETLGETVRSLLSQSEYSPAYQMSREEALAKRQELYNKKMDDWENSREILKLKEKPDALQRSLDKGIAMGKLTPEQIERKKQAILEAKNQIIEERAKQEKKSKDLADTSWQMKVDKLGARKTPMPLQKGQQASFHTHSPLESANMTGDAGWVKETQEISVPGKQVWALMGRRDPEKNNQREANVHVFPGQSTGIIIRF